MIEPRLYRAAFIPAAIALVVTMFSFVSRPPPLRQGLPADVLFEGTRAAEQAQRIARERPDRRPGSRGNRAVAAQVAETFAERGFQTRQDPFEAEGRSLLNVVGRRPGPAAGQIVIVAARDAASRPDLAASAADTAALLEFARVFEGRATRRTIVLASVDGSTLGEVGARRLVERLGGPIDAALVMSNLGASRPRGGVLVPWSNDARRENIGLQRTASESLRLERGEQPGPESLPGQLVRLGFPLGIGAQGVLLDGDVEAIRFSGSGELPPPGPGAGDLDAESFGAFGRSVLRTASALDMQGAPVHGPERYLTVAGRRLVPGWALSLLSLTLILPALVAAVDAFARARRRREPVGRAVRWVGLSAGAFVTALAVALLLALVGLLPAAPAAAFAPGSRPLTGGGAIALGGVLVAAALAWTFGRHTVMRYVGGDARPAAPGTGAAVALVLSAAVLAVWALNPAAALFLVPALHLWMIAAVGEARPRGGSALLVAGLLPLLLAAAYYLVRLGLDPLAGAWYVLLLITGGHVGLPTALLGCLLLGLFAAMVSIMWARFREGERAEPKPTVRGPVSYAGPGSLGGTESALRR